MSDDDDLLSRLDDILPGTDDPLAELARLLAMESSPAIVRPLDLKGTLLDGYRLQGLLGVGGMGATYQALSPEGEAVAVKIAGHLSPEAITRFQAEAQALQQLSHPGIVGYRSHGLSQGYAYLVMDLVPGASLQQVLDDLDAGRTTPITARLLEGVSGDPYRSAAFRRRMVRILAHVADALQVCHAAGVVHRDVKPANVLLRPDLGAVLIDFGFSRDLFRSVSLTKSAVVLGTVGYMAPEQLRARLEKVSGRTDLFSLGLVLYRCLTGRDLREDYSSVFAYHRRPLLLPKDVERRIPVPLQHVLYGCLEPKPERRYATASALAEDLRATITGDWPTRHRPGWVRRVLRSPSGRWTTRFTCAASLALAVWMAWAKPWTSPPYLVTFDAINDSGILALDGATIGTTPMRDYAITPGDHVLAYTYAGVTLPVLERRFTIAEDRRFHRIHLLTINLTEGKLPQEIEARTEALDPRRVLLYLATGSPENRLSLDGEPVRRGYHWVAPGDHTLEAISPEGFRERQTVTLRASEQETLILLPEPLQRVPGRFRKTLSNAMNHTLPDGIELHLDDGVTPHLNAMENRPRDTEFYLNSCFAPMIAGTTLHASLRVTFPERMRSLAACWEAGHHPHAGEMRIEFRTEGTEWREVSGQPDGKYVGRAFLGSIPVTAAGSTWFELRATMRVGQLVETWSPVEFLASYIGEPDKTRSNPAFAIVADPEPGVCVVPEKP